MRRAHGTQRRRVRSLLDGYWNSSTDEWVPFDGRCYNRADRSNGDTR
jgi:hypothetical protein